MPSYAPDLNPVEGVWSLLRCDTTANVVFRDRDHLVQAVRNGLRRIQRRTDLVEGCLAETGLSPNATTNGKVSNATVLHSAGHPRFPDRLAGHFTRKACLVPDGHSARRARTTRARLADRRDRVELSSCRRTCLSRTPKNWSAPPPQTQPSDAHTGPRPGPTRLRNPQVLPPPESAAHPPQRLLWPAHPLRPRIEPSKFRIKITQRAYAALANAYSTGR